MTEAVSVLSAETFLASFPVRCHCVRKGTHGRLRRLNYIAAASMTSLTRATTAKAFDPHGAPTLPIEGFYRETWSAGVKICFSEIN